MNLRSQQQNASPIPAKLSPQTTASYLESKIRQVNQVLVIEAEELVREMLVNVVVAQGHGVITASDGCAALTLLKSLKLSQGNFPFDLIILAWTLPKIDGIELCRWLRHQGNCVPILVLISKESEADPISVIEAGANDYLPKPFSAQELITRCRVLWHCYNLSRLPESKVLHFKEVNLYAQEHRVVIRGKQVNISPKEFRLLELFMTHPGLVWSRQQLFEQVWGPNFAGRTKTLDVHISWLRQKLELNPGRPQYIKTVPKVGYRFG